MTEPNRSADPAEGSLSSRRAWIEMEMLHGSAEMSACRSPHGERGLKYRQRATLRIRQSRSPHGERGLKLSGEQDGSFGYLSLSSRRAWIEM